MSYYCPACGKMVPSGSTECPHMPEFLVRHNTAVKSLELTNALAEIDRLKKELEALKRERDLHWKNSDAVENITALGTGEVWIVTEGQKLRQRGER